jgi:hypothetical protein
LLWIEAHAIINLIYSTKPLLFNTSRNFLSPTAPYIVIPYYPHHVELTRHAESRLRSAMSPLAQSDGHNTPWLIGEAVPGEAAMVEDIQWDTTHG